MKRSNTFYLAVSTMNGEPLSKADYKRMDTLTKQAQEIVDESDRRLTLAVAKT